MTRKPSLAEFQAAISEAVMRPLGPGDGMRQENHATANALIKPNERLTSSERLQIYNQQYWWRLLGTFTEDFRGLRAVLGVRKFERLAVAYLSDCGSHSWNLRDLGSRLVGYLEQHPELTAPRGLLALEMAQVEWARVVAFDEPGRPLLDVEAFSHRKPERMILKLQPYIALLEIHHPIDRMLGRLKRLESSSASNAVSAETSSRPIRLNAASLSQPLHLIVHRLDLLVYYKRVEPEAFSLLSELSKGQTLETACETAFSGSNTSADAIASKVQSWFQTWMSLGWLCD